MKAVLQPGLDPRPGRHRTTTLRCQRFARRRFRTVWIDRDLSWLEFNRRVLAEALDERTPLLERVKFLAIFGSNLDEFFMKRMAVLREDASPERRRLLGHVRERLRPDGAPAADHFLHCIVPELSRHRIHLRRWSDLSPGQRSKPATTSTRRSRRR